MMRRLLLVLTVATLALAGCSSGSDDGDKKPDASKTSSSAPTDPGPACADIWKADATLPADYDTCYVKGMEGAQDVTECDDDTRLIVYNNEMFARTGSKIVRPKAAPLQDLPVYSKAYTACTGE